MENEIIIHLNDPKHLETMYRENKQQFKREFNRQYPELAGNPLADFWNERLNFEKDEISWGTNKELTFVIVAAFIAGLIAKIPEFTGLDPDFFYPRNLGFVIFPLLASYFAWKQKIGIKKLIFGAVVILASALYINLLPNNDESDTLVLACIHLLLLLWAILGFAFVGEGFNNFQKRLDFLRFNGDLIVMTTVILIAGGLMTGITLGLFELIGLSIEDFYFNYIAIWGLAAAPIVGTYLVRANPHLVNKVSPVIAKVFTPLLLVMLVIYLFSMIFVGKNIYTDRDFLLIFNALLIGVMAIILFSIAERSTNDMTKFSSFSLFGLSVVTVIVNGIALSAIVFRISEWGITPNRLAVLGGNILILIHLLIVTFRQFEAIQDENKVEKVENSIASFLPVYIIWAVIVTFIFPVVFHFE